MQFVGNLVAVLSILLIGNKAFANMEETCKKYVSQREIDFSESFISLVAKNETEKVLGMLDSKLRPQFQNNIENLFELFKKVQSYKRIMVGCISRSFNGVKSINLSYQWEGVDRFFAGNVAWIQSSGKNVVMGLSLRPIKAPLQEIHKFSFKNKGLLHWVYLTFACILPFFVIFTAISCFRAPIKKRKWLWIIFILFGCVFETSLNWTSGELSGLINNSSGSYRIAFGSLKFLGAGYSRASVYSPVMISIAFPLGAIIFLIRRRKLVLGN